MPPKPQEKVKQLEKDMGALKEMKKKLSDENQQLKEQLKIPQVERVFGMHWLEVVRLRLNDSGEHKPLSTTSVGASYFREAQDPL